MPQSPVVLEVGPEGIRRRDGGHVPPAEMVAAVIDGIDDRVVLFGERPVRVDDLLRSVIAQALGGRCAEVLVVHPPEWPVPRVARVLNAARPSADRVASMSDGERISVAQPAQERSRNPLQPIVISALLGIAVLGGGIAVFGHHRSPAPTPRTVITSTVVEGRVAIEVPDGWTVERLTRGPGSPRVRVTSPGDPDRALHLTQSYAPGSTLAGTATVLGRAAAGHGEFTDFHAADEMTGRPAVTYREVRPGRVVRWVVLLDGATRISIGCQSRPGAEESIRMPCEQAIRSARELGGTAPSR